MEVGLFSRWFIAGINRTGKKLREWIFFFFFGCNYFCENLFLNDGAINCISPNMSGQDKNKNFCVILLQIAISTPGSGYVMLMLVYNLSALTIFQCFYFICTKVFPSSRFISFLYTRQEWGHNTDLHVALSSAEHHLLQSEYEDYAITQTSSIACLRSVTLIVRKQMWC